MRKEKRPYQEGARRVMGMREILERISKAGKLYLESQSTRSMFSRGGPNLYSSSWLVQSYQYGSRQNELDPTILDKLPPSSATTAASIHNYWTSIWKRATEGTDLSELIKMAEMNTAQSHVLNCEFYKVLAMKVDELCSMVVGVEDIDALRLENQTLLSKLEVF
ncbi:hypothetical protein Fot_22373 [Forsythia ovata]|uniref:Uncharacterized protein n=1 Tax=Forsythia ovata TaxID=205694 RepID=A0ABD1UXJ6_9LAMI